MRTHPTVGRRRPVRSLLPLAVCTGVFASTLVAAGPAAADPTTPTTGLPGSGQLSEMALARPATLAEAEQQFTARTPVQFREQELRWAPCPPESFPAAEQEGVAAAGLECATVTAPRDWLNADDGEVVELAISRLPQPQGRPARTVLSNPGGPGGAGLSLPVAYGALPATVGTEFIGIDVRGTGASTKLACAAELYSHFLEFPDTRDRSTTALAEVEAALTDVAGSCAADPLAPFITTEQTVADYDLVRHVLGRSTVDYYGASGGTWTGAQYVTYFPARVGRFVLDSTMDVTATMQDAFGYQPMGLERRLREDFAGYAAEHGHLFGLGRTPAEVMATYEQLRTNLTARPIVVEGQDIDGFAVDSLTTGALYSGRSFENHAWTLQLLRLAHAALVAGDLVGLDLFSRQAGERMETPAPDPFTVSMLSTLNAIKCNDTSWPQGADYWNARGDELGPQFPLRGWQATWEVCGYWDRPELTLPKPDGRDLPPILVLQALRDGHTPVEGAERTAAALPGTYLTVTDGDHGVLGRGNACVDDVVGQFFADGTLPGPRVECPGTPVPAPGAASLG